MKLKVFNQGTLVQVYNPTVVFEDEGLYGFVIDVSQNSSGELLYVVKLQNGKISPFHPSNLRLPIGY